MNIKEIKSHCSVGSGVCVYRKRVKKAQFIVQSIYIYGGSNDLYEVQIEFDPMSMLGQGEGLNYRSKKEKLEIIVETLESFIGLPIAEWENFTKTGNAPFYDSFDPRKSHLIIIKNHGW